MSNNNNNNNKPNQTPTFRNLKQVHLTKMYLELSPSQASWNEILLAFLKSFTPSHMPTTAREEPTISYIQTVEFEK